MKELSFEEMKEQYNKYINNICDIFKIVNRRDFSKKIAKHITNRPLDIESNELIMKDWTEQFHTYIVEYSSYSLSDLQALFSIDMNLLLTKQGSKDGN